MAFSLYFHYTVYTLYVHCALMYVTFTALEILLVVNGFTADSCQCPHMSLRDLSIMSSCVWLYWSSTRCSQTLALYSYLQFPEMLESTGCEYGRGLGEDLVHK